MRPARPRDNGRILRRIIGPNSRCATVKGKPCAGERVTRASRPQWSQRICCIKLSITMAFSTIPAGRAAGVAFETGAVADQCEVAALLAAVALIALDPGGADAFETEFGRVVFLLLRNCRNGEGAFELGRGSAGAAMQYSQFAPHIPARGTALHDRRDL